MKNMKKLSAFLLICVFCVLLAVSAFSAMPRLVDDADLLRSFEEDIVLDKLNSVSEEHGVDVVVVTVQSTNGEYVSEYAGGFYDNNGYGDDGILLLLCMESREYWFSTTGRGMSIFTDSELYAIEDRILSDLSDGRYYNAFCRFADLCGDYLNSSTLISDDSEDVSYEEEPFDVFVYLLISLGIGFVIALIVVSIWRAQLKTVKFQSGASGYIKQGSLKLTQSNDTFLYHTVNRVPRAQSTSSGGGSMRSSSGRSHGGRGGKF